MLQVRYRTLLLMSCEDTLRAYDTFLWICSTRLEIPLCKLRIGFREHKGVAYEINF